MPKSKRQKTLDRIKALSPEDLETYKSFRIYGWTALEALEVAEIDKADYHRFSISNQGGRI